MPPAAYGRSCPKAKVAYKKLALYGLRRINVINFQNRSHFFHTDGFTLLKESGGFY